MWHPCSECSVPIIIGIGGATRSGKTTLAKQLKDHFAVSANKDSFHICQDEFFETSKMLFTDGFRNCETPEAINMEQFINKLQSLRLEVTIPCKNCAKKKSLKKKVKVKH